MICIDMHQLENRSIGEMST